MSLLTVISIWETGPDWLINKDDVSHGVPNNMICDMSEPWLSCLSDWVFYFLRDAVVMGCDMTVPCIGVEGDSSIRSQTIRTLFPKYGQLRRTPRPTCQTNIMHISTYMHAMDKSGCKGSPVHPSIHPSAPSWAGGPLRVMIVVSCHTSHPKHYWISSRVVTRFKHPKE